ILRPRTAEAGVGRAVHRDSDAGGRRKCRQCTREKSRRTPLPKRRKTPMRPFLLAIPARHHSAKAANWSSGAPTLVIGFDEFAVQAYRSSSTSSNLRGAFGILEQVPRLRSDGLSPITATPVQPDCG